MTRLLDPTQFELTAPIEAAFDVFRRDFERLDESEWVPWPLREAYDGSWMVYPMFLFSYPDSLGVDFEAHQARCAESMAVFGQHERICAGAFSRMDPGCHIFPHTDHAIDNVLRMHLPIDVPPGSKMRVGDEFLEWEEGKCIVFDGLVEHETANLGQQPRTVVLIDFFMTEVERAIARPVSVGAAR